MVQPDRRYDLVFRQAVEGCLLLLAPQGCRVVARGRAHDSAWVDLLLTKGAGQWQPGMLVLRLTHCRGDRLLLAELLVSDPIESAQATGRSLSQFYPPKLQRQDGGLVLAARVCEWYSRHLQEPTP